MARKFPVFLEYDIEYGGFVADCPTKTTIPTSSLGFEEVTVTI